MNKWKISFIVSIVLLVEEGNKISYEGVTFEFNNGTLISVSAWLITYNSTWVRLNRII